MMASLADACFDWLNKAKVASDVQKKLLFVAQIREIILHRDTALIPDILPDLLELLLEKHVSLRKVLIKLAGECMLKNITVASVVLEWYAYLVTENNESFLRGIASELGNLYSKLMLYIVELPPKTKATMLDPKELLMKFKNLTTKLEESVSLNLSDNTRIQCIKLIEDMILFGIPLPLQKLDPRLARSQKQNQSASGGSSVTDIPLTHPLVNRNEVEQEAESLFNKCLLWATKPQTYPFSPVVIANLGQTIASISVSRPKKVATGATVLTFLLQSNICTQMTNDIRDDLYRSCSKLLRISSSHIGADSENIIGKLREALELLEKLGINADYDDATTTGDASKKRVYGADAVDDDLANTDRAAILAAVDAAEHEIKTKQAKIIETGTVTLEPSHHQPTGTGTVLKVPSIKSTDTELASELAEFPDISPDTRLAHIPIGTNESVLKLIPPETKLCTDMSLVSLSRILESFNDLKMYGPTAIQAHAHVAVRSVILMSIVDLLNDNTVPVFIISSYDVNTISNLADDIPLEINLPRPLWLFLSFILTYHQDETGKALAKLRQARKIGNQNSVDDKMELLIILLRELHSRVVDENDSAGLENPCASLYEFCCLVIVSRLLQNIHLRPLAKKVFTSLNYLPLTILKLLKLLTHTGAKAGSNVATLLKGRGHVRDSGVRSEARELLGHLVLSLSIDSYETEFALQTLLWCTVSDDFETRDKTVKFLLSRILQVQEVESSLYKTIITFALQSAINAVGVDVTKSRISLWKGVTLGCTAMDIDAVDEAKSNENENSKDQQSDEQKQGEALAIVESGISLDGHISLVEALDSFNNGVSYDGEFPSFSHAENSIDSASYESFLSKSFHMVMQLCLSHPSYLLVVLNIYGAVKYADEVNSPTTTDAEGNTGASVTNIKWQCMHKVLRSELKNVIPLIAKKKSIDEVFNLLAQSDPCARLMVEHCLALLHSDIHMPATPKMIMAVKSYISNYCNTNVDDGGEMKEIILTDTSMSNISIMDNIELILPILGGLLPGDIELILPTVISKLLGETTPNVEGLKNVFSKIIQARPPPLTKSALILLLHRLPSGENALVTPKQLLECTDICIKNKEEFESKAIIEVLTELLSEVNTNKFLMRTSILSSQQPHHYKVKEFLFNSVIPTLLRKKVWGSNKGIWDGVKTVFNPNISLVKEGKDVDLVEPTLRCVLGLHSTQLKEILKIGSANNNLKLLLATVLKRLSILEKDDILSGKWSQYDPVNDLSKDAEKQKIIKELQSVTK